MTEKKCSCQYLDYGETCPSAYGAFCTKGHSVKSISLTSCDGCQSFEPDITNFTQWWTHLSNVNKEQVSRKTLAQLAWYAGKLSTMDKHHRRRYKTELNEENKDD